MDVYCVVAIKIEVSIAVSTENSAGYQQLSLKAEAWHD